jgi:hypothetical protein
MSMWCIPKVQPLPSLSTCVINRAYSKSTSLNSPIFKVKLASLSCLYTCLFICFESHEQFFSYLATVTITVDEAVNLNLRLSLTAFSSEGSCTCHTYFDTGPPFLRSERPVILTSECRALDDGAIITYFKRLRFDAAGPSGARNHDLPNAKREH